MEIAIIAAVADNGVIGCHGQLPWRLSSDLQRFKQLTWGARLIMGRTTFDSIGRPLPGRRSIVLTSRSLDRSLKTAQNAGSLQIAANFSEALQLAGDVPTVFVIGGRAVYQTALPKATRLYWTAVHAAPKGDVEFPKVDWSEWERVEQHPVAADPRNDHPSTFQVYRRRNKNADRASFIAGVAGTQAFRTESTATTRGLPPTTAGYSCRRVSVGGSFTAR